MIYQHIVPVADQFLVGVAEENYVYGLAEFPEQGFGGFAFGKDEAGAVAGGGDFGAWPLDVVNHADGDGSGVDYAGGVGEAVAFLNGVFVATDGEDRGDDLEVVEDAEAFEVAAVQDEVNSGEGLQHFVRQVAATASGVGVGD